MAERWRKIAAMISCCWIFGATIECSSRSSSSSSSPGIGVNWGSFTSVKLDPAAVVEMLEANGIERVKLFDADPSLVNAFRGSKIELTVGLPNDKLELVATLPAAARNWVRRNVTHYLDHNINIKYVAIGNEPFLKSYNGSYQSFAYPALQNIQAALRDVGKNNLVKATIPMNADVLAETVPMVPSAGRFRTEVADAMGLIVAALAEHGAPFVINIYPFLSLAQDPHFPKEFAFLDGAVAAPLIDGARSYSNAFDASYDTLVAALARIGFPDMAIVVGEIGWPSDGHPDANLGNAQRFLQGLVDHVRGAAGTPLRKGPIDAFLFSLLDEDRKPIAPGSFERHWGIFASDGQAKFPLDLHSNSNSSSSRLIDVRVRHLPKNWCVLDPDADLELVGQNMEYACGYADCTPLYFGGSCNEIGGDGNASFAFNSYFQVNQQERQSCHFDGLGTITTDDPSMGSCVFALGIQSTATHHSSFPSLLSLLSLLVL